MKAEPDDTSLDVIGHNRKIIQAVIAKKYGDNWFEEWKKSKRVVKSVGRVNSLCSSIPYGCLISFGTVFSQDMLFGHMFSVDKNDRLLHYFSHSSKHFRLSSSLYWGCSASLAVGSFLAFGCFGESLIGKGKINGFCGGAFSGVVLATCVSARFRKPLSNELPIILSVLGMVVWNFFS